MVAALLSTALMAGCNGRNNDNAQNTEQNQAAAPANGPAATDQTVAPAPPAETSQAYSSADRSSVPAERPASPARATTGRPDTGSRTASSPRNESSPQANSSYNNTGSVGLPRESGARTAEAPAPAPRLPEYREVTIPAGTSLPLEMTTTISSSSAQVEAPVAAKLSNDLTINGETAIPAGAILHGNVTDVERAGRVKGRAHLSFAFDEVNMNGSREDLKTNPLTFQAEATKGEDATKVGVGAVGGAILGGILGGKKGAAKGAAGGAAAGTGVVLATRGDEVTVNEGTNVTATLAQPMTVRVRVR
jgi:hypothetical protein